MIGILVNSLFIGYSGALMPGSLLTYTLSKSLKKGVKAGLLVSIGHSLLELVLVVLALVGIGSYLKEPVAQVVIGIIGGLVLVYFGIGMIKDAYLNKLSIHVTDEKDDGDGGLVVAGIVISASNPYFIVWWAGVGLGMIMSAYRAFGLVGVVCFYFGHILADISWYVFISALFSKTKAFINLKVYKVIIYVLGIVLAVIGISFVVNAISTYINL